MRGDENNFRYLSTSPTAVSLYTFNNAIPEAIRNSMEVAVDHYSANTPEQKASDEVTAIVDFAEVPDVIAKLYKLDRENWAQIAQGRPIDDLNLKYLVSVAVNTGDANDARGFFKSHGAIPNRTLFEKFFDEPFDIEPLSLKLSSTAIARARLEVQKMSDTHLRAMHKLTSEALAPYERGLLILNKELSNRNAHESTKTVFPETNAASSRKRKGIGR